MSRQRLPVPGTLLNDTAWFSAEQLCRICRIDTVTLTEMVAEGVVEPAGRGPRRWRFSGTAVVRVQTVLRLQRDLRVNLPGAALALDLMDEIESLRGLCNQLGRATLSRRRR